MRIRTIGFAVLATLGLSACAGTRPAARADAELDHGKIAAVNEWALQRGAKVMWLNSPTRARTRDADEG